MHAHRPAVRMHAQLTLTSKKLVPDPRKTGSGRQASSVTFRVWS